MFLPSSVISAKPSQISPINNPCITPSPIVCPRVRSLAIRAPDLDSLGPIVRAFPAVTRFEFETSEYQPRFDPSNRQRNSRTSWSHLDYLRANPGDVYAWNLAQPVRYWDMGELSWKWETEILEEVLKDCPPTCLAMELNPDCETRVEIGQYGADLALEEVFKVPSITHLFLKLMVECNDEKRESQEFLVSSCLNHLDHMKLTLDAGRNYWTTGRVEHHLLIIILSELCIHPPCK